MENASGELNDLVARGYRFALSLTNQPDAASDLLHDAWFALLRRGGPWNRQYLFTTVRNRFIDRYRHEQLLRAEPIDEQAEAPCEDDAASSSESFTLNGNLAAVLDELGPEERAVLFLSAVEGLTAQAIADLLEWPRGTVLGVIHRAKAKLRRAAQGAKVQP